MGGVGRTGRGFRPAWIGAALGALLALVAEGCATSRFAADLPQGLPDVSSWQRSEGRVDFTAPARRFEYQLYINPARPGVYSVTRYRITHVDPSERRASDHTASERLQWDADGRDVRRYQCEPVAGSQVCQWREMVKGGAEYQGMLPALIQLYALHSSLLHARERAAR